MTIWVMVVCTQAWVMCGQKKEYEYPTEESCYTAMNHLYDAKGRDNFKYIVCKLKTTAGGE